MDKAITTTFMLIVSITVSVMVFNTVYPAVAQSSESLVSMSGRMDERMKSQIEIIHISGELDKDGNWQDVNGDGHFDVSVWVKNVGSKRLSAVAKIDVLFGPEGNFALIPYKDDVGGGFPYWDWSIENDTHWNPTATARITIHYGNILGSGRYFVKVVTPSGIADDDFFAM